MVRLNAFIARSFAPQDEERVRPVLEFLDTFRKAGFICETAEAAEVESVSKKVQRMIGEKDVFIGFFTKRYPVYRFESRVKGALQMLFGSVEPEIWSAPPWVLQESGYALRAGKNKTMAVTLAPTLQGTDYASFAGKRIQLPTDKRLWPSIEALSKHNEFEECSVTEYGRSN